MIFPFLKEREKKYWSNASFSSYPYLTKQSGLTCFLGLFLEIKANPTGKSLSQLETY